MTCAVSVTATHGRGIRGTTSVVDVLATVTVSATGDVELPARTCCRHTSRRSRCAGRERPATRPRHSIERCGTQHRGSVGKRHGPPGVPPRRSCTETVAVGVDELVGH